MPKNAPESAREKTGNKTKKNILLMILIILAVLAGSSAGTYFYFSKSTGEAAEPIPARAFKTAELQSMDMGEMIVNLVGAGNIHYLRIKITIEYPKERKLDAEIKKKKHQVSDVLINTLRSKTISEVISTDGVEKLKIDLIKGVNEHLECGKVTGVYFTDFLVQ